MTHHTDPSAAIAALTDGDSLRVWSFIVTLFGDLAAEPGAALSGAVLAHLTGMVGIKPASVRVALHRLRKDGWIVSRRAGRASLYELSPTGRRETLGAGARIYDPHGPAGDRWHLLLAANAAGLPEGARSVMPGVALGLGPAPEAPDCLVIEGRAGPAPGWLRDELMPPELRADYARLEARLEAAAACLPAETDAAGRAVLRALVVHGWRRLLLRHADLPDDFLGGPVGRCRRQVAGLLARLGPVRAADLENGEGAGE